MSSIGGESSDPDVDVEEEDFALFSDVEEVLSVSDSDSDPVVIAEPTNPRWFSHRNASGLARTGFNPFSETVMDLHAIMAAGTARRQAQSGLVPYDEASGDEPMPLWSSASSSDNLERELHS